MSSSLDYPIAHPSIKFTIMNWNVFTNIFIQLIMISQKVDLESE
jgi:hypothetical protein